MEPIKVTFLGTSGSVPQKDKNFASLIISYKGENLLFDCPEGTQRQIMSSPHSLMKINHVFISHMHADHFRVIWLDSNNDNEPKKRKISNIFSKKGKEKSKSWRSG